MATRLPVLWGTNFSLLFLPPTFWLHRAMLTLATLLIPCKSSETRLESSNGTLANAEGKYKLKATWVMSRATELQRSWDPER